MKTNINMQSIKINVYLGKKIIFGDLKIENNFSIPYRFFYPYEVATFIIMGLCY
jgi:hypothetical protein